jgi:hypothetical protein
MPEVVPFERGVAEIVDAARDVRRDVCFNPLAAVQVDDRAGPGGDDDRGVAGAVKRSQEEKQAEGRAANRAAVVEVKDPLHCERTSRAPTCYL